MPRGGEWARAAGGEQEAAEKRRKQCVTAKQLVATLPPASRSPPRNKEWCVLRLSEHIPSVHKTRVHRPRLLVYKPVCSQVCLLSCVHDCQPHLDDAVVDVEEQKEGLAEEAYLQPTPT